MPATARPRCLSGLALQVPRGRVVTVIGPNGAGKSTLLNSLMGLLRARGRIVFDGASLADVPLEERVMRGLSLVPETRELFGSMPVEDNLVLGGYRQMRRGVPHWRARDRARVHAVPAPAGAARCSWPARCRAASARCWRWAAR